MRYTPATLPEGGVKILGLKITSNSLMYSQAVKFAVVNMYSNEVPVFAVAVYATVVTVF